MTIAEIEDAIVNRLKSKGIQVREIDIQKGIEGLIQPAVFVAVEEGSFKKVSQDTFNQTITIVINIVFRHLKNEKERRRGIYPILEGIIGVLTLQDLGLKIEPLNPKGFRNVTDNDAMAMALQVYQVEFETSYNIKKMDDEIAVDLIRVGLNYYLKPGDDVVDASDSLTLGG